MQGKEQQNLYRYLPKEKSEMCGSQQDHQQEVQYFSTIKRGLQSPYGSDWTPLSEDWLTQQKQNAKNMSNVNINTKNKNMHKLGLKIKEAQIENSGNKQFNIKNAKKVLFKFSRQQSSINDNFNQDSLNLLQGYDFQSQKVLNAYGKFDFRIKVKKSPLGMFSWQRTSQANRFLFKCQKFPINMQFIQEYAFIKKLRKVVSQSDRDLQLIGRLYQLYHLSQISIQKIVAKSLILCGVPHYLSQAHQFVRRVKQIFKRNGKVLHSKQYFFEVIMFGNSNWDTQKIEQICLKVQDDYNFWELTIIAIKKSQQFRKILKNAIKHNI